LIDEVLLKNDMFNDKLGCVNKGYKMCAPRYTFQHLDKVDWYWWRMSTNPNVIPILETHMDKVDWGWLSSNPNAIHLLVKNLAKVNWDRLSANPNAIRVLENNIDKVNWKKLSSNPNPNAIRLL
jgi:hypothetical protein